MDEYENLVTAIIVQAAHDYMTYPERRKKHVEQVKKAERKLKSVLSTLDNILINRAMDRVEAAQKSLSRIDEEHYQIELFFKSKWFRLLTDADGNQILASLQEEMQR